MDVVIKLIYHHGYSWYSKNNIFVKGFIYGSGDEILEEEHLIDYFQEVQTEVEFKDKLGKTNGLFSVIILKENQVFFAVDYIRTFPLFFAEKEGKLFLSDAAEIASSGDSALSGNSISEFLYTGYVTGKDTLLKNVFQVQAGSYYTYYEQSLHFSFYHLYKINKVIEGTSEKLQYQLSKIFDNVAKRLLSKLNGRTALLPLSGGYDSRIIAALLKKGNYHKVICYTYGSSSNPEVKLSQKIAKQLNFQWYFIPYDKKQIEGFVDSAEFKEFYPFASNFTSSFFTQDYFAIKFLKENNLIPDDAVVIPGHTSNFDSGIHLIKGLTRQNIISNIIKKHFSFRKNPEGFEAKIAKSLINAAPLDIFDNWNMKERLAKFINNSNRIYEFWGVQHLIPLWDKELMDFFQNLSPEYRINKRLYKKTLSKYFFEQLQINFFIKKYPLPIQKIMGLKNRFIRRFFVDPLNFKLIAAAFQKNEKLKTNWDSKTININSIQSEWYISKIRQKKEKIDKEDFNQKI